MLSGEATNSLGKAWWHDSTGACESWQARVRPNWLCDFYTYSQARMRVFVFVTYSSLKHVNPSRQLAHKDTTACDIATKHVARPPTYLPTYLPTCLPTYLPTYLPAYLPTYLHAYPPANQPNYRPTYLPAYLPTYLPAGRPTCPNTAYNYQGQWPNKKGR